MEGGRRPVCTSEAGRLPDIIVYGQRLGTTLTVKDRTGTEDRVILLKSAKTFSTF